MSCHWCCDKGRDGAQTRSCKLEDDDVGPPNTDEERFYSRSSERANAQSETLNMKRKRKKGKNSFSFRPFNSLQFVSDRVSSIWPCAILWNVHWSSYLHSFISGKHCFSHVSSLFVIWDRERVLYFLLVSLTTTMSKSAWFYVDFL